MFDAILKVYLDKIHLKSSTENPNSMKKIKIYYRNRYTNSYKTDERILKTIIKNNVNCVNSNGKTWNYYLLHEPQDKKPDNEKWSDVWV